MPCCPCFGGLAAQKSNPAAAGRNHRKTFFSNRSRSEIDVFEKVLATISKVPLFQSLPKSEYPAFSKACVVKDFEDGTQVITQGEMGDAFYVVMKGNAKVVVDGKEVSTLGAGAFFGELALLHDRPRAATIVASQGTLHCAVVSREDFKSLGLHKKLNFNSQKRNAMIVQDTETDLTCKWTPKTKDQLAFIRDALINNKDLQCLKGLTEQQLQSISNQAFAEDFKDGTDIILQGDTKADLFYIIEKGTADVFKDGEKVASLPSGASFGGVALLYQAPRSATVKASSDAKLWCVTRSALRAALQQEVKMRVAEFAKLLDRVQVFNPLSSEEKELVADALMEITYAKGDQVTVQGQKGEAFFMLEEGELAVIENGEQTGTIQSQEGSDFPCFGEDSLVKGVSYPTTIKVLSSKAKCLALPAGVYRKFVVQDQDAITPKAKGYIEYDLDQLKTIGLLGCGGFGKVTLELYQPTGEHLAMKKISKGFILQQKQEKSVMNESNIMRMTHSPFLVQCAATFNSSQHLFFLLEPCLGGELFTVYKINGFYGKERLAIFHSACVVKGFQHLHERCIVYRDMKPENLLLDDKGYCKIADFGLAKFCIGKTFTTCGTPDYFAPELIKAVGHTTSLDWWTLGILIYELMCDATPFSAAQPQVLISRVMAGIESVKFPPRSVSSEWPGLVKELCKSCPTERLPVRPGGLKNLEQHPWYAKANFDWASLEAQKMRSPFVPEVEEGDLSNFAEVDEEDAPPELKYVDPENGWDEDFEDRWGPKNFKLFEAESKYPDALPEDIDEFAGA